MKKLIALAALSAFALAACKDNTQAQLQEQQKQIEALQQLVQQNTQQDNTVYELTADAVKNTIPAEFQTNGNSGEPVTGTDGQQYIYDQSTGSWLLQSLIGAAAGAFIGNALANKFQKAKMDTPAARRAQANYYQSSQYRGSNSQQLNTRSVPAQNAAANANGQNRAATPNYRQANKAPSNYRKPARRGFGRRR